MVKSYNPWFIGSVIGAFVIGLNAWIVNLTEFQDPVNANAVADVVAKQLKMPSEDVIADKVLEKLQAGEELPEDIGSRLDRIERLVQDPDAIFSDIAELMAMNEVEDDAKGIREFLNDNGFDIEDKDDVEDINVKDAEVTIKDKKDGDYDVEMKLRVEFYDATLNEDIKETVYAFVEIRDGEVDDTEYSLTSF